MNIKIDLNVCRVCLRQPQTSIELFDELNWNEKFTALLGIKLEPNDGLSTILCPACFAKLKTFDEFQQKAVQSDACMRNFLNNIRASTIEQFNETFIETPIINEEEFEEKPDTTSTKPRSRSHSFSSLISYQPEPPPNDSEAIDVMTDGETDQQNNDEDEEHTGETKADATENVEQFESTDYSEVKTDIYQMAEVDRTVEPIEPEIIPALLSNELDTSRNLCLKCNKQFSTKTNLLRHAKTHDGSKPFQCQVAECGAQFTQATSLKQHQLIHDGIRPFMCRICSKTFTQSKSLRFHLLRHTGEKPHQCVDCYTTGVQVSFRQKDALKRHIAVKHPQVDGPYQNSHTCQVCQRRFQSNYALKVHSKMHFSK